MTEILRIFSVVHNSAHSKPEQMKAYQQWRRRTTELVLQIHHANTAPADLHLSQFEGFFATSISEVIVLFMRSNPEGHKDELSKIMYEAIALDMEMSRQLPRYTWRFSKRRTEKPFHFRLGHDDVMKVHSDERTIDRLTSTSATKARVYLVVAPGLTQRGLDNSPSTSFEGEYWAVPMEVTCSKPKRQKNFGSTDDDSEGTVE